MIEYTPSAEEVREQYWAASGTRRQDREAWSEFDRWLAAHDAEVRKAGYDEAMKEAAQCGPRVAVAEEPEGKRWFSAAYRAQNGNVIPIGDETVLAEFAQKTVADFAREDDEGPEYFLASRLVLPWVPAND